MKNVFEFNQQLHKVINRFAETFLSQTMLYQAGPLTIFCK